MLAVGFEPTRTQRAEDLKSSPLDHSGKPAAYLWLSCTSDLPTRRHVPHTGTHACLGIPLLILLSSLQSSMSIHSVPSTWVCSSSTASQSIPLPIAGGVSSIPLAMSSIRPGMSKMASSSRKAQLGVQGSAAVAMMCCWWPEEEPDDGRCSSAACAAAHRMSSGTAVRALGSVWTESGKLRSAVLAPRSAMAATSCARAAISGVGSVPSQMRACACGALPHLADPAGAPRPRPVAHAAVHRVAGLLAAGTPLGRQLMLREAAALRRRR
jgi:hypothetical protein